MNKRNGIAFVHDYIPSQKQKYHVTNVDIVKEKQKYQVTSFARKMKVSFYITQLEEQKHQSIPNNS